MVFPDNEIPEPGNTEVLYGNDNIIKKTLETFSWTRKSMMLQLIKPVLLLIYYLNQYGLVMSRLKKEV